jgi:hypothetical protein
MPGGVMDLYSLKGRTRQFVLSNFGEQVEDVPAMNPSGEWLMSQDVPERTSIVRQGKSWGAQIPTASAFTFVAAWPTTRAELVLSNGEPTNGQGLTYVIDRVWMALISSAAAAQPFVILGQLNPSLNAIATAANNTAVLVQSLSGIQNGYQGNAKLAIANTAFALTNHWFILGSSAQAPMTTNLSTAVEADCKGRYLVPPGAAFCLAGLSDTAAGTAIIGVEWHERFLYVK